jgi:hypothetical protein
VQFTSSLFAGRLSQVVAPVLAESAARDSLVNESEIMRARADRLLAMHSQLSCAFHHAAGTPPQEEALRQFPLSADRTEAEYLVQARNISVSRAEISHV